MTQLVRPIGPLGRDADHRQGSRRGLSRRHRQRPRPRGRATARRARRPHLCPQPRPRYRGNRGTAEPARGRDCLCGHRATDRLWEVLAPVKGALVDPKRFAVAVHYREVAAEQVPAVEVAVDDILDEVPQLRKTGGKKVFKRRPRLGWDKGKVAPWLRQALGLDGPEVHPFYLGPAGGGSGGNAQQTRTPCRRWAWRHHGSIRRESE